MNAACSKKHPRLATLGLFRLGLIIAVCLFSSAGAYAAVSRFGNDVVKQTTLSGSGLTAGPNATVLKDGLPYRGIGVNYYNCFLRTLSTSGSNNTSYDAGFALLAQHHIPFARFCATGFCPNDMALYQTNKPEYFRRMDGVVAAAEAHGIGLIPSLFWFIGCVPDLVGEPCNQWGNPLSKTHAFMRQYVRDIVTRYKNSPAIWAWEFGNEYNCLADFPAKSRPNHRVKLFTSQGSPAVRTENDDFTTTMLATAFSEFAKAVRLVDSRRLITNGADFPRPNAWHFYNMDATDDKTTWTNDTQDQFQTVLGLLAPEPINLISVHCYDKNLARLGSAATAAATIGKPLFVGEFNVDASNTPEAVQPFKDFIAALDQYNVPLAAVWVFDFPNQESTRNISVTNGRSWQLDVLDAWNTSHKPR